MQTHSRTQPSRSLTAGLLTLLLLWQSLFLPALAAGEAISSNPSASGTGTYDLVTSFGYDELGHKIWQADALKRVTRFGYDIRGRQIWRKLPMDEKMETMEYNVGGQLEKQTDFRGYTTTFVYDVRGRMILKTPDVRLQETQLSWDYPDENTRIAYRGASSVTQRYDKERGWLNRVENKVGDKTSTVSYSYNPEGQKTATNTQSGSTLYSYDVLGRLATVRDQMVGNSTNTASDIARYDYDAVGNLTSLERGNGVDTSYTFNEQNRLKTLDNKRGTSVLSSFGYTVRGDGKRTAISEQIVNADAGRVSSRSLTYAYDDAGKLTGERGQNGLGYNYENLWDYDAVGNRVGTTARRNDVAGATQSWAHTTVVTSQFNENDQLISQTSVVDNASTVTQSYSYDANGAEKTVASKSGNVASGSSVNGWDFEGKLRTTQAKDAEGADNGGSSNAFDAMGNRLWHVADVGKPSQKTTSYVVDTDTSYAQVVEESSHDEKDSAGAARLQARYVWGQGLAPLAMWRRGNDGAFKLFYFVSDGQESVRQLTNTAGEVTDSYFYDAWGNTLVGGSGNTANPFRYTGQQLDSDGRYYLRARFYNPGNGRFLSHDPLMGSAGDPVSMHRYLYAGGDGVNFADPSGNETLVNIMTSIGVNATLASNLGTVVNIATNVTRFVSAYNILSEYSATGSFNWVDVAFLSVDVAGSASKLALRAFRGIQVLAQLKGGTAPIVARAPELIERAVDVARGESFRQAREAYNRAAGIKGLPKIATVDELIDILRNETQTFRSPAAKAGVWSRTHLGRFADVILGNLDEGKNYWLQFGDEALAGVNSERMLVHELLHMGAMAKGQSNGFLKLLGTAHEVGVSTVATPTLLYEPILALGGGAIALGYGINSGINAIYDNMDEDE